MEITNVANVEKMSNNKNGDGRLREIMDEMSEKGHKGYFGRRKQKRIADTAMELATRAQKVEQLEKYASIYFRLPIVIDQTLLSIINHPYTIDSHRYDIAAVYLCGSCAEVKDFLKSPKPLEEVPISDLPWPPKDIDWIVLFEQRVSWPKPELKKELEARSYGTIPQKILEIDPEIVHDFDEKSISDIWELYKLTLDGYHGGGVNGYHSDREHFKSIFMNSVEVFYKDSNSLNFRDNPHRYGWHSFIEIYKEIAKAETQNPRNLDEFVGEMVLHRDKLFTVWPGVSEIISEIGKENPGYLEKYPRLYGI